MRIDWLSLQTDLSNLQAFFLPFRGIMPWETLKSSQKHKHVFHVPCEMCRLKWHLRNVNLHANFPRASFFFNKQFPPLGRPFSRGLHPVLLNRSFFMWYVISSLIVALLLSRFLSSSFEIRRIYRKALVSETIIMVFTEFIEVFTLLH